MLAYTLLLSLLAVGANAQAVASATSAAASAAEAATSAVGSIAGAATSGAASVASGASSAVGSATGSAAPSASASGNTTDNSTSTDNATAENQLNGTQIAGIIANFNQSHLLDFFPNFHPQGLIEAQYTANTSTQLGQPLALDVVANFPAVLMIKPGNGSDAFNSDSNYTAMLIDAGPVGTNTTGPTQTLHWLINTIHLNESQGAYILNYSDGTTITEYAGPNPPQGSGPHRYVFALFDQPENFTAPSNYSAKNTAVGPFDLATYLNESSMGAVVAANYFTVENGQATVSLAPTTAVESSTLSNMPVATGNGSGSEGGNGTDSGSGGGSGATQVAPGFTLAGGAILAAAIAALV